MKQRGSRFLWVISCTGEKGLRTESRKSIEEILKSGLATIFEEEPEVQVNDTEARRSGKVPAKSGKMGAKARLGRLVSRRFANFGDTYVHFMVRCASRGSLVGITRF